CATDSTAPLVWGVGLGVERRWTRDDVSRSLLDRLPPVAGSGLLLYGSLRGRDPPLDSANESRHDSVSRLQRVRCHPTRGSGTAVRTVRQVPRLPVGTLRADSR